MSILDAEGVSVGFAGRPVLTEVSLSIAPGTFTALLGPNGAGKTTLLRALAGLTTPLAGRVTLGGVPMADCSPRAQALVRAYMAQLPVDEPGWRVAELVMMGRFARLKGLGLRAAAADHAAVRWALERAGVTELADRPLASLSGGQRQRAHLARALAQEAPLLFLDEPTAHLDLAHQLAFHRLVAEAGLTVVAVLHDLNLAAQFCDRLIVVGGGTSTEPGRVLADGTPETVLTPPLVAQAFGLAVEVRHHPETGRPYMLPVSASAREPGRSGTLRRVGLHRMHVVCGGGAGDRLLPALNRMGYALSAGVLNMLDSDEALAARLGVDLVVEAPFSPVTPAARATLDTMLKDARTVVVADVAWGPGNVENLRALHARMGEDSPPRVFIVGAGSDFTEGEATRLRVALLAAGAVALDVDALLTRLAADA